MGPIGPTGPTGATGVGVTGATGVDGVAGADGVGVTGPAGEAGPTGTVSPFLFIFDRILVEVGQTQRSPKAECPEGWVAISGGYRNLPTNWAQAESAPGNIPGSVNDPITPDPRYWEFRFSGPAATEQSRIRIFAYCAQGTVITAI